MVVSLLPAKDERAGIDPTPARKIVLAVFCDQ
jgi:hypothetical protein